MTIPTMQLVPRRGQPTRRRVPRALAMLVALAFGAAALLAIATHDLDGGKAGVQVATPATLGPSSPTSAPTPGGGSTGVGASGSLSGTGAGSAGAGSTSSGGTTTPTSSGGGTTSPTSTPTTLPGEPAIISPTLKVFAFGSKIGLPLLCSVAISGASGQLTDPNLSQLAATIATSCQTFGQQGDAALRQLSSSLSALAVVNPAVQPAVAALVTSFNQFGSSDVPFGSSLIALAKILTFFGGG